MYEKYPKISKDAPKKTSCRGSGDRRPLSFWGLLPDHSRNPPQVGPVAACISPWRAAGGCTCWARYNSTPQPWVQWIRIKGDVVVLSHGMR